MSENVPLDMCAQRSFRLDYAFAQSDQNLHWANFSKPRMQSFFMRKTKTDLSLGAHTCIRKYKYVSSHCGSITLGIKGSYAICELQMPNSACASAQSTVINLSTGTPFLLTILVLNFDIVHSTTSRCVLNIAVWMANSVDPDQTPLNAASDLGLHGLQRPICPNT